MKRKKITIDEPLANIGDEVRVLNYRRHPAEYEFGVVESASYSLKYKSWSYGILLGRRSKNDNPLRISADDESIDI